MRVSKLCALSAALVIGQALTAEEDLGLYEKAVACYNEGDFACALDLELERQLTNSYGGVHYASKYGTGDTGTPLFVFFLEAAARASGAELLAVSRDVSGVVALGLLFRKRSPETEFFPRTFPFAQRAEMIACFEMGNLSCYEAAQARYCDTIDEVPPEESPEVRVMNDMNELSEEAMSFFDSIYYSNVTCGS